ncbi:MAG: hypothetical protein AAF715_22205 [Myxococcota bacterium]
MNELREIWDSRRPSSGARTNGFVTITVALLTLALTGGEAKAQVQDSTWLNDRRYREGAGWRVGDFELHPGIGADFGYDSNFFRRSGEVADRNNDGVDELNEPVVGALRLKVSPHFSIGTLGQQRREGGPPPTLNWRLELQGTYNEFIPVSGPERDQDNLRDQRSFGFGANTSLDILPGREWSGNLRAGITRTVRPTNEGDLSATLNRLTPTAGAALVWQPGSGLLDWSLGYAFSGIFFESGDFSGINNFTNEINTRGRWRFLPRTALIFDGRFGFINYIDPDGLNQKTNSTPLRARLGVNGLISESFGVLAMVGWGASFYATQIAAGTGEVLTEDFDSVIAQAEVKYYITPAENADPMRVRADLSSVTVGFSRDFEDSFIGTFIERNFGYVRFDYFFGGAFLLAANAQGGAVTFPPQRVVDFGAENRGGWTDARVDANLLGEYRIRDWLGVNLDVGYTGYFSGTELTNPTTAGDEGDRFIDALAYQIFRVFGGVRVFL